MHNASLRLHRAVSVWAYSTQFQCTEYIVIDFKGNHLPLNNTQLLWENEISLVCSSFAIVLASSTTKVFNIYKNK